MREAIGMIETTSVGIGYQVQDAMLKAADVELVLGRTVCSGKYINVVTGAVAAVEASVADGREAAVEGLIDYIVIPNVHASVFAALGQSVTLEPADARALGVVETYSAASILEAADAAAKAAAVTLFRIHLAMALGGKGFVLMTGSVADCTAGVQAGAATARAKGLLVSEVVIPGPRRELYHEYI
ncbi:MAG: BMC domain-containing protein [Gemmatimonadales bacterium]|nr:BMC domain-containing protein [Gemmatimonadales bacterium]